MGDRAVFGFRQYTGEPLVFLYSHWGGASQETDLAEALTFAAPRWHDGSYGTRMMLTHLTRDAGDGDTGYGIYAGTETTPHAGDYRYTYIVDFATGKVQMVEATNIAEVYGEVTFDEFVRNPFLINSDLLMEIA